MWSCQHHFFSQIIFLPQFKLETGQLEGTHASLIVHLHEKESYSFKFEKRHRAARLDSPKRGALSSKDRGGLGGGRV